MSQINLSLKLKSITLLRDYENILNNIRLKNEKSKLNLKFRPFNQIYFRSICWQGSAKTAQFFPPPIEASKFFSIKEFIIPIKVNETFTFYGKGITLYNCTEIKIPGIIDDLNEAEKIIDDKLKAVIFKLDKTDETQGLNLLKDIKTKILGAKQKAKKECSEEPINFIIQVLESDEEYRNKGKTLDKILTSISDLFNPFQPVQKVEATGEFAGMKITGLTLPYPEISPKNIMDWVFAGARTIAIALSENQDDNICTFMGTIDKNSKNPIKLTLKDCIELNLDLI